MAFNRTPEQIAIKEKEYKATNEELKAELVTANETIEAKNKEIESLKGNLSTITTANDSLKLAVTTLEGQKQTSEEIISGMKETIKDLKKEVKEATK